MKYLILLLFPLHLLLALTLNDEQGRYSHFNLSHVYDASNKLTIEDMPKQSFETGPSQFTYGYLDGTRWFKLALTNTSNNNNFVLTTQVHLYNPHRHNLTYKNLELV